MKLRLEKTIQSRNKFVGRHWSRKHKDSKSWEMEIRNAYFDHRYPSPLPKAKGWVEVKITSVRHRLLDYDNLVGGCKGLVDAIKRLGWIVDDSPKHVKISYEQKKLAGTRRRRFWSLRV